MNKLHFLCRKTSKNLICYIFDFLELDEKIQKMKINKICFNLFKNQKIYIELKILNKQLLSLNGLNVGVLLDNNAEIFMKIVKSYNLEMNEDFLASWIGRWLNKNYFESI